MKPFLDVTENKKNISYATPIAQEIKKAIKDELGLVASAGVAPNRFLAKIASDFDKPDGLYVIKPHQVEAFMEELPIKRIWGVGKVMGKALEEMGIHKAVDVRRYPLDFLEKKFGKWGVILFKLSQGIDESEVKVERQQKSIGKETTFREDIFSIDKLETELHKLSKRCVERLNKKEILGEGILEVKVQ